MSDYKNIIVGVDFSGTSEKLIDKAVKMSVIFNAKISLVHVVDYLPPTYVAAELPSAYVSKDVLVEKAKTQLAKLTERFPDSEFDIQVVVGARKKSIREVAKEVGADLAIVGKHDPNAIDRFLGSTALGVINHAELDVLVVHV